MAAHRKPMWAIRDGGIVELYDLHPFEADAVRLADFRTEDFTDYFRLELHDKTPYLIRFAAEFARNK